LKVVDIHQDLYQILESAIRQDRQAQKVLYNKFAPKMLGVCRQYVADLQVAEDLLVTSFMKVFSNLHRFEKRGHFEGWMRRIFVNECISYIRSNQKVRFVEEDMNMTASDRTDASLLTQDIQAMIDMLPEGCKMVFNLFAVEGYKHQEIADILGITEGTSKSQLAYARKILQQTIQQFNMADHA
jgi:RNA polymerase sigma-70 factor (ECF subfamily)